MPGLALVADGAALQRLLVEAAAWAERLTVCVSAPDSVRGTSAWWRELLARCSKCDGVYVRRAEQAEAWLLHRLHAAGCLRLVEVGGKQVAANLIIASRGDELRVLLSHISLERALAGAAFGALLSFRGSVSSELGRACRAQLASSRERARIPTGSEIDALTFDPARRLPAPTFVLPRPARVLTEPAELAATLARWTDDKSGTAEGVGASVRPCAGGFRVSFERAGGVPLVLSLQAGAAWAAGNALLLDAGERALLVWRGDLLGHSPARRELSWSECRTPSFVLESALLGLSERVAVVAHTGMALTPQLDGFARELARLGELFGVEPPPALAHVLAELSTLSSKQQTRLVWRALIGLGALELEQAARVAAEALRDQGYLRGESVAPGSAPLAALSALVDEAADAGRSFDRPCPGYVRAIQPALSQYTQDDWLACLLGALPEGIRVAYRSALRRTFERARDLWGLRDRFAPDGAVERAIEGSVGSALRRGLLVRVGAGLLVRPGRAGFHGAATAAPGRECVHGFVGGWARAIESLAPVPRSLVTRRSGWYGKREPLASAAQRLGLTIERARQIEIDAWRQIESSSSWASTLRVRLERALATARAVSLRRLVLDDPWWRGAEQHLELCEAALENLCDTELWRVELGAPGARETFFARFSPAELERAFEKLMEDAAQVPTPAMSDDYRAACEAAAAELDAGVMEYLSDALASHFVLDPADPRRIVGVLAATSAPSTLPTSLAVDSEALLRLEDVLRSVFRSAGTPLGLASVAERVRQRLDASDDRIAERLVVAPFVQRNADQYGLIARDVPGGSETIAAVLEEIVERLASSQRALGWTDALAIAEAHVKRTWSEELLGCLIANDSALQLSSARDVSLRRWQTARLVPHGAPVCPGVPASLRQRFDRLSQQPWPGAEPLRRRVRSELGRIERTPDADDVIALPLARQLCDLSERLLDEAASAPPEAQQLSHAAIGCVLGALALPEDEMAADAMAAGEMAADEMAAGEMAAGETLDEAIGGQGARNSEPGEAELDAPPLDAGKLAAARAVMLAVLRWLDRDWLDRDWLDRDWVERDWVVGGAPAGEAQSGTPMR